MFKKLKQAVGMVGIKVELVVPTQIGVNDTMVEGKVLVNAEANQHITKVKVEMKQVHREESDTSNSMTQREYEIGEVIVTDTPFDIKAGENAEFPFTLSFARRKSGSQALSEMGGKLGMLGGIAKALDNESDRFYIEATVDVKGAALDPSDKVNVHFFQ
jgi:hypothetical protein